MNCIEFAMLNHAAASTQLALELLEVLNEGNHFEVDTLRTWLEVSQSQALAAAAVVENLPIDRVAQTILLDLLASASEEIKWIWEAHFAPDRIRESRHFQASLADLRLARTKLHCLANGESGESGDAA